MATSQVLLSRSLRGISNIAISRKKDDLIFNLPKPSNAVLAANVEVKSTSTRDSLGNMAKLNTYQTSEMPTLQLAYGVNQPGLYAFQAGYLMQTGTFTMTVARNVLVPLTALIPAATTGFFPYGTALDVGLTPPVGTPDPTTAAYSNDVGDSVALTQTAYSSTAYVADDQFGLGENGALTFSTNLIGQSVTVKHPYSVQSRSLGSELIGEVSIDYTITTSANSLVVVNVPSAIINPSGSTFDASGEGVTLNFELLTPAGSCRAYTIYELSTALVAQIC